MVHQESEKEQRARVELLEARAADLEASISWYGIISIVQYSLYSHGIMI